MVKEFPPKTQADGFWRAGESGVCFWTDERKMPDELVQLLQRDDLPEDLRRELWEACNEIEQYGAVTYPTKARIEYQLHEHSDYLSGLSGGAGR